MTTTTVEQQRVEEGSKAPDFELPDQLGKPFRLADVLGESNVVLYFYPQDETPACTSEACAFRDEYDAFRQADAEVIGISSDPVESHKRFARRHDLPFRVLSDVDGEVRRRYGVPKTLGVLPGRVSYVIDRTGIVRHRHKSMLRPRSHIRQTLKALRQLEDQKAS